MKTKTPPPDLPPFRIEIRHKGSAKNAPWSLFGIALSEEQRDTKLADYPRHFAGYDFRAVVNDWNDPNKVAEENEELESLRDFRAALIKGTGTDDLDYLAAAVKAHEKSPAIVAGLEARANLAETALRVAKDPEGATGASPVFPFGPGDHVRDIHTGVSVRVIAVGPEAKGGEGFDWEGPGGEFGHCPIASVGCFEPEKKKAHKHSAPSKARRIVDKIRKAVKPKKR